MEKELEKVKEMLTKGFSLILEQELGFCYGTRAWSFNSFFPLHHFQLELEFEELE